MVDQWIGTLMFLTLHFPILTDQRRQLCGESSLLSPKARRNLQKTRTDATRAQKPKLFTAIDP
jgi:hypothetical protein